MEIEGLHVASVHPILFRGGLDVIVHDTGKLFASMGVHLHYYTVEWREAEWQIPDPTYCSLSLFPAPYPQYLPIPLPRCPQKHWGKANLLEPRDAPLGISGCY